MTGIAKAPSAAEIKKERKAKGKGKSTAPAKPKSRPPSSPS
jgi:hypothetical protein